MPPEPVNPLLPTVLRLLRDAPEGLSEYQLLKQLEREGDVFPALAEEADLALFQKHFLLMNALYRLQDSLWREEHLWLAVSPLHIGFAALPDAGGTQALRPGGEHALRAYYLDWRQFETTDGAAVAELLAGFWRRLHAGDRRAEALAALDLSADSSWAEIKQQYRRLAARSHPDRGGARERFLTERAAYEYLRSWHAEGPG
jgi:DnaJ-domain-containing protein 1